MATSEDFGSEEKRTVSLVTYSSDDSFSGNEGDGALKASSISVKCASNVHSPSSITDSVSFQQQVQGSPLDLSVKTLGTTYRDSQGTQDESVDKTEILKTQPSNLNKDAIERVQLPLPSEILELYDSTESKEEEDLSQHGGKIRSFPHERGVWATYLFIEYEPAPAFENLIDAILKTSEKHGLKLTKGDNYHITLSRTVKLRHHCIRPFIDNLKPHLQTFYRFNLTLQSVDVYLNEEKTRTFLGLKVHIGKDNLLRIVERVDRCLQEFQLPVFFQAPSFHLSIAWSVGNITEKVLEIMPDLQIMFQSFTEEHPECRTFPVSKVNCKSGNKIFVLPLKEKS